MCKLEGGINNKHFFENKHVKKKSKLYLSIKRGSELQLKKKDRRKEDQDSRVRESSAGNREMMQG